MGAKVKLSKILEGMEMQSDDHLVFVDLKAGEVVSLLRDFLRGAEDGKSFAGLPDWQIEQLELAYDLIEHEDNYLPLPTEFDIHEYSLIEDFCYTVENSKAQDALFYAIRGKGAFRRFKDKIIDLDLDQAWYDYREQRYKQIAIEFCEMNNLEYENK